MAIKEKLSELSINQLQELTGKSYRTVRRRLERLEPARKDGKTVYYSPRVALPLIYGPEILASEEADPGEATEEFAGGPPHLQLTKQRTRFERLRADKLQLEIDVLKRKLFPAEKVKHEWEEMTGNFRAKILGLPARLALQCAQSSNAAEIEALLRKTVHEALAELAEYDPSKFTE